MTKSPSKTTYTYAVGRRKSSVATVKLFKGKSDSTINQVAFDKYFPGEHSAIVLLRPFEVTDTKGKFYYQAKILGGGKVGQLDAVVLAISRALVKLDESNKTLLRAAGLLTVDSRVRERRMVGTGGKARRQKQSPKR
jgi:small subunit ribosomal protein S9